MQIAARIRQVGLEYSLSLEDLAAKTGLPYSLLARFENGEEVPSLKTFDRLAEAMGVPVQVLFYGNLDLKLTPWLTPRVTMQQLIDKSCRSALAKTASLLNLLILLAAIKMLQSFVTNSNRRQMGKTPRPTSSSSNPPARAAADTREDARVSKPKS